MNSVKDLLGHRVVVEGKLRYRADGSVSALLSRLKLIPSPSLSCH